MNITAHDWEKVNQEVEVTNKICRLTLHFGLEGWGHVQRGEHWLREFVGPEISPLSLLLQWDTP